jgi:tRNA nucleotidyltransferase (CCA-adding enzyme)
VTVAPQALLALLPKDVMSVIDAVRASLTSGNLYLVGGVVRDAARHQLHDIPEKLTINDLDFVIDLDSVIEHGNARELAARLQGKLGGTLTCHEAFGTYTLALESLNFGKFVIDIATARSERYDPPGSLPTITFSDIATDLVRRDFSINALALRLQPEPLVLLDPQGGLADIATKHLRILHPQSFSDDPTRILRGARLAGRLSFTWEARTHATITKTLTSTALANVSKDRLKHELELTLAEPKVTPALEVLNECGALFTMFGMRLDKSVIARLDELRLGDSSLGDSGLDVTSESYLLALLLSIPETELEGRLETFGWPLRYLESVKRLHEIERVQQISSATFAKLSDAEKTTVRALSAKLAKRIQDLTLRFKERRLTGKDVLDLGLEPGPDVGSVLANVAKARDLGEVHTFEDELALAKQLVQALHNARPREITREPR